MQSGETVEAHRIYGIERWGRGLVTVMASGDVGLVDPLGRAPAPVSLPEIMRALARRGIQTPVLLRVAPFFEHGIRMVNEGFRAAIAEAGYRGAYRGVFPIKVNQQAQVVRRIVEYGRPYGFGLEAGSKPELVVALSRPLPEDALVICNGVKDEEFIRLAILSRRLGFNTVIVIESPKEVDTIVKVARDLGQEPLLGVRIKLTNTIGGAWAASSGDRSTFGLNAEQLVAAIDRLREAGFIHCLMLQHSHLGSQVPDVNDVRRAATEACRYFVELAREGVELTHLDLGGGLGIDYTGEMRATESSVNYTVAEYCASVVETVRYALDEAGLDHPTLVTESGRAVVALSAVLIFDVLEATLYDIDTAPEPEPGDHHLVHDLAAVADYMVPNRLQECINDATFYRNELRALFRRGAVGLREVARGERIYLRLMSAIRRMAGDDATPELEAHLSRIADIYHCNFSLFQSLPDMWAIDQLHPVVPIQRLDEPPDRRAILSDITCDSDGKIDRFVLADGPARALPVHHIRDGEAYYIGVFFVGAYQETLGDLHNLFGDTNVATISLREDGGFDLVEEVEGDTVAEVLSYVEYSPRECLDDFRRSVDRAISGGRLDSAEGRKILDAYRESLNGYTYYE